jgi:four helix bundle protein
MIKTLEEFKVYNLVMELGEKVWGIVMSWDHFQKDTLGKHFVRSTDSIAANLSEGLGRYHYKESKNFGYYSRGSLFETKTWLTKASNRKLLSEAEFSGMLKEIETIGKMVNGYINSIGNVAQEPEEFYGLSNSSNTLTD